MGERQCWGDAGDTAGSGESSLRPSVPSPVGGALKWTFRVLPRPTVASPGPPERGRLPWPGLTWPISWDMWAGSPPGPRKEGWQGNRGEREEPRARPPSGRHPETFCPILAAVPSAQPPRVSVSVSSTPPPQQTQEQGTEGHPRCTRRPLPQAPGGVPTGAPQSPGALGTQGPPGAKSTWMGHFLSRNKSQSCGREPL